jgi:hypothetical protein
MGETQILTGNDSGINANDLESQQTTLAQAGLLQTISFYVASAAGQFYVGARAL